MIVGNNETQERVPNYMILSSDEVKILVIGF